jgi:hypothetical protein
LALVDWQSASVRPLWRCARTPYWLLPSLAGDDDACKQRLRSVFRAAVANDPVFVRAVDADDTRHALDEVAEYDAFRDGFPAHSLFLRSALCPAVASAALSGLSSFSCAVFAIFHTFSLDFSSRVATHATVVISNPHLLCAISNPFFLLPIVHNLIRVVAFLSLC